MTAAASKPARKSGLTIPQPVRVAAWLLVIAALVFASLKLSGRTDLATRIAAAQWTLKAPDFALIASQSLVLKLHLFAALTALGIGIVIMLKPKGVGLHKTLGWSWVIAMALTAISSFFLTGVNGDSLSLIHLLSGWVVVALPIAVTAIRRRNVNMHRRMMTGLFVGGLLVAGGLTFIPGRLMWAVFFG